MPSMPKIKITDDRDLRFELDALCDQIGHVSVAKWALLLAGHIFSVCGLDVHLFEEVFHGIEIFHAYQEGKASLFALRQSGFAIAFLAKEQTNPITKAALRVMGHAVSCVHMKGHAMVAADYAIKVINLQMPNNMDAVKNERIWQVENLKKFL